MSHTAEISTDVDTKGVLGPRSWPSLAPVSKADIRRWRMQQIWARPPRRSAAVSPPQLTQETKAMTTSDTPFWEQPRGAGRVAELNRELTAVERKLTCIGPDTEVDAVAAWLKRAAALRHIITALSPAPDRVAPSRRRRRARGTRR